MVLSIRMYCKLVSSCTGKYLRNGVSWTRPGVILSHCNKRTYTTDTIWEEMGVGETPKLQGNYRKGQHFIHKVLGYRGVVIRSFTPEVFESSILNSTLDSCSETIHAGSTVTGNPHKYYLALVDRCDLDLADFGSLSTASKILQLEGLDYVSHDEIFPYKDTNVKNPVEHVNLQDLLSFDLESDPVQPHHLFKPEDLIAKERKRLKLHLVYRESAQNIKMSFMPVYLGDIKEKLKCENVWRLIIRIENLGEEELLIEKQDYRVSFVGPDSPLQVRRVLFDEVFYHNRHIKPWLTKERPAIQFNNTIIDSNSSGEIWGTITFKNHKGSILDFKVPKISMESR